MSTCTTIRKHTLILNDEEADALLTVLDNVGGCGATTRRKLTSNISAALYRSGANRATLYNKDLEGEIYFITPSK